MSFRDNAKSPAVLVVAIDGHVHGVDAATGQTLWEHEVGMFTPRIIVTDTQIIVVGEKLVALAYPSGEKLWERPDDSLYKATITLDGGRLFCAKNGKVACFSALDGTQLWTRKFPDSGRTGFALGTPFHVMQAYET